MFSNDGIEILFSFTFFITREKAKFETYPQLICMSELGVTLY